MSILKNKISFFFGVLLCVAMIGLTAFTVGDSIVHPLKIHHPGMKEDKDCKLIERKTEEGKTLDFFMDVQSVICLDGKCKIVDIRLIWDRLGDYLKYELADGVALEKKDGEAFVEEDYEKLHEILKDKNSILSEFALGEVVDVKKDDGGIDGISGATILTDETASVKGAAWTCYTLWHWANGEINTIVDSITQKTATKPELFEFLNSENIRLKKLGLQLFEKRGMYDDTTLTTVKNALPNLGRLTSKAAIAYLKNAPEQLFFLAMSELFPKANDEQRVLYLKALFDEQQPINGNFLNNATSFISQLKNYREVNLTIDFLQKKEVSNSKVNEALLPFLQNENFIIARRIYWYLNDKELKPKARKKVKGFERKHKDSL